MLDLWGESLPLHPQSEIGFDKCGKWRGIKKKNWEICTRWCRERLFSNILVIKFFFFFQKKFVKGSIGSQIFDFWVDFHMWFLSVISKTVISCCGFTSRFQKQWFFRVISLVDCKPCDFFVWFLSVSSEKIQNLGIWKKIKKSKMLIFTVVIMGMLCHVSGTAVLCHLGVLNALLILPKKKI